MNEWYLNKSDDHDMAKAMILTEEIMNAVVDMVRVMVTSTISVQDPLKNLGPGLFYHIYHVGFFIGDLHLVLIALNLSTLNTGILIMVLQVRLIMFLLKMVDYSMSFLSMSF